jgi:hypothetical protein
LGRVYCILSKSGPVGHTLFHALSNLLNNLSGDRQLQVYRRSRFLLSRIHGVRLSRITKANLWRLEQARQLLRWWVIESGCGLYA